MTTTDFMEEQEVFDLLKKKKLLSGAYVKNVVSRTCSHISVTLQP
jgi:hypothetical protein